MLTAPLTGARYPEQTDGPLGGLQIGYAVADLEDNTIPRFATTGERDTAYAAWVAGGGTMAAGLHCTVAGRLMRHNGAAWAYVPTHRGAGATFPSAPVDGDLYRHDLYRSTMLYHDGLWRQAIATTASSDADRAAFLTALTGAGLTMHGGFLLYQTDSDQLWAAESGTTLTVVGGYGARSTAQVQRLTMAVNAQPDPDIWVKVTNWATVATTPDITIATNGTLTVNRTGWLSVTGYAFSDSPTAGRVGVALDIPAASFPVSRLVDIRQRPAFSSAYDYSGLIRAPFSWSGRVVPNDAFAVYLNQDNAANGQETFNVYAAFEYLA